MLLLHINNNDRARRKGESTKVLTAADHCPPQTDQRCTWTKRAQWHWLCLCGESTPLLHPHDSLLKLCTAISPLSEFRLQRGERQLAPELRTHLCWMLTAATQAGRVKKISGSRKAESPPGDLSLSPPLHTPPPPPTRDTHGLSKAGPQMAEEVTLNQSYLKISTGNKTGKSRSFEKEFIFLSYPWKAFWERIHMNNKQTNK